MLHESRFCEVIGSVILLLQVSLADAKKAFVTITSLVQLSLKHTFFVLQMKHAIFMSQDMVTAQTFEHQH